MSPAAPRGARRAWRAAGFTLTEMMVTLVIFSLIAGSVMTVLIVSTKQKSATSSEVQSTQMARIAVDMLARDLRTAGFGVDFTHATPQTPIAYIDSVQVLINSNQGPFPDTSATTKGWPLAYNPTASPKPKPLNGTSWTPVARYRTGAETIRWTLDLDNDGLIDSNDLAQTDGTDASRTPNPNDFELCREVYGDSSGAVAGNNGGSRERIALVKKPGSGTPALFRVFLSGDPGPWNWANGPVPANRLAEITRIEATIVATSPGKNFLGQYSDAKLTTTVSEMRNAPTFQDISYTVSGFVFEDKNKNGVKDGTDVAIAGVDVVLGGYLNVTTSSTGFYSISAPPGTYVLKHYPPDNYGTYTKPDSFVVTVGPNVSNSFADTLRAGGWVTVTVFNDVNKDKKYAPPDQPMIEMPVSLAGSDAPYTTDDNGQVDIFAPVGTYTISTALPDSFVFSTTHPVTGSMTNGATKTALIGMYIFDSGTISGTVFSDKDGDGVLDGGEAGIADAYVSCTLPDSTLLYTYSSKTGAYSLRLPVNDPPHTTPYTITCDPPSGFTTSSGLAIYNVYVKNNDKLTNKNFALGKFAIWDHDLKEPLNAMAAADFVENDWTGTQTSKGRQDLDLVFGTDAAASSHLEQLFNRYNHKPMYNNVADVRRGIVHTALAVATDTLDAGSGGISRPDVILGTRYRDTGNFSVWYTQNGSGNEGYLATAPSQSCLTADNGDVQAIVTYPGGAEKSPSIIVGTRSTVSGHGTIEVWTSATHATPTFIPTQTLPPAGLIPSNNLGEVTCMALGDVNADGTTDLVVGTQTGTYSGQVMEFKSIAGVWTYQWSATLASDAVMSVAIADVNNDNKNDIVVGTMSGLTSGHVIYYQSNGGAVVTFKAPITQTANGIVTSLNHADYNGDAIDDILVGWRDSATTFSGGLEIWYTTTKTLPSSGTDATTGQIKRWVTDIVVGNFNYGTWPVTPASNTLLDIAAVTRTGANTGQIIVLTH